MLPPTALAAEARRTMLADPACQELPELSLDELRQASPIAGVRRHAQERLQMRADDLMQHRGLGVSWMIHGRDTSHAPG